MDGEKASVQKTQNLLFTSTSKHSQYKATHT